jgi:hypothetical protein
MNHISQQTSRKIQELVGNFVLVSVSSFEAHGQNRTRYTVRKPAGAKLIHLIGHDTGAVVLIA